MTGVPDTKTVDNETFRKDTAGCSDMTTGGKGQSNVDWLAIIHNSISLITTRRKGFKRSTRAMPRT